MALMALIPVKMPRCKADFKRKSPAMCLSASQEEQCKAAAIGVFHCLPSHREHITISQHQSLQSR